MLAALGLSLNSTLINPSAGRAAGGATVLSVTVLPNPPSMGGVVRLKLQLRNDSSAPWSAFAAAAATAGSRSSTPRARARAATI